MAMSFSLLRRPLVSTYTCRSCLSRLSRASRRPISFESAKGQKPNPALPTFAARTRFAPSPTGYLHLGSLRTALFNYLLAKRTGGQFLLRIEDTDQKRTVHDAEQRLFDDLRWAGLQWDEGPEVGGPYGPYKQSERSAIYKEHAHTLLESGNAYRCFCSTERLNALAEHRHKLGIATDYDRTCAIIPKQESDDRASKGESHTIRLKVPDQYPAYKDLIYGTFRPLKRRGHVTESAYEDPILLKSDGLPTYHLANVYTQAHRHVPSLWLDTPEFAHVGLLVDEAGNKLSKRNFDTDIAAFREMEIFPETLTNFAALLGWSHREKKDIMDLQTLIKNFTLKFTKGNTTVTFGKMQFLQRKHALQRAEKGGHHLDEMVTNVATLLTSPDSPYKDWKAVVGSPSPDDYIRSIVAVDAENYTNANEFLYRNSFLFTPLRPFANAPPMTTTSNVPLRAHILGQLQQDEWNREKIMEKIHDMIDKGPEDQKPKPRDVYHYLRKTITGQDEGMRIYDVMLILGRRETLARLGVEV
ncbi:hypothetical protein PTNB73_04738 [Pyrenophora teres f. teres]|nr:hypothetical protein PTNB73_04738 [Pyrenophora teres f. teres]